LGISTEGPTETLEFLLKLYNNNKHNKTTTDNAHKDCFYACILNVTCQMFIDYKSTLNDSCETKGNTDFILSAFRASLKVLEALNKTE